MLCNSCGLRNWFRGEKIPWPFLKICAQFDMVILLVIFNYVPYYSTLFEPIIAELRNPLYWVSFAQTNFRGP